MSEQSRIRPLRRRLWAFTKHCAGRFDREQLTDRAAALTYYGMLSLFPALLVLVSFMGVIGKSLTEPLVHNLTHLAPSPARSIFIDALGNLGKDQPTAGILLFVSLIFALWSASGYIKAFARSKNAIFEIRDPRPFWEVGLLNLLVTMVFVLLLALIALAVAFSGPLAKEIGHVFGIGDTPVKIWGFAKWPVLILFVTGIVEFLLNVAPAYPGQRIRWFSPGVIVAVVLWGLVSAGFALFVSNFGHYGKTYGSLASVVIFLIWLWLTNVSFLLGAVVNAEYELGKKEPRRAH